MLKLPRIPRWVVLLCIAVGVGLLIWGLLSGWLFRTLFGGALIVAGGAVAAAGKVVEEAAKSIGAQPIEANDTGRSRRPGKSAVSPKPEEGKKRARPLRNRGGRY